MKELASSERCVSREGLRISTLASDVQIEGTVHHSTA